MKQLLTDIIFHIMLTTGDLLEFKFQFWSIRRTEKPRNSPYSPYDFVCSFDIALVPFFDIKLFQALNCLETHANATLFAMLSATSMSEALEHMLAQSCMIRTMDGPSGRNEILDKIASYMIMTYFRFFNKWPIKANRQSTECRAIGSKPEYLNLP